MKFAKCIVPPYCTSTDTSATIIAVMNLKVWRMMSRRELDMRGEHCCCYFSRQEQWTLAWNFMARVLPKTQLYKMENVSQRYNPTPNGPINKFVTTNSAEHFLSATRYNTQNRLKYHVFKDSIKLFVPASALLLNWSGYRMFGQPRYGKSVARPLRLCSQEESQRQEKPCCSLEVRFPEIFTGVSLIAKGEILVFRNATFYTCMGSPERYWQEKRTLRSIKKVR